MNIEWRASREFTGARVEDLFIDGRYAHSWISYSTVEGWEAMIFPKNPYMNQFFQTKQEAKDRLIAHIVKERLDAATRTTQ